MTLRPRLRRSTLHVHLVRKSDWNKLQEKQFCVGRYQNIISMIFCVSHNSDLCYDIVNQEN